MRDLLEKQKNLIRIKLSKLSLNRSSIIQLKDNNRKLMIKASLLGFNGWIPLIRRILLTISVQMRNLKELNSTMLRLKWIRSSSKNNLKSR